MSAKTSNQPGRRTPLSLTGGLSKGGGQSQSNKGGGNSAQNSNGQNDNTAKVQGKPQAAAATIEKNEKKQQQQNGVSTNHKASTSNNQQQSGKEKQQNEKESAKVNKKVESATQEKSENIENEKNKGDKKEEKNKNVQEKFDKNDQTVKNNKNEKEISKENGNKTGEKVETANKKEEKPTATDSSTTATAVEILSVGEKDKKEIASEKMEFVEEVLTPAAAQQQVQQQVEEIKISAPPTPKSTRDNKSATPIKPAAHKTEKTPQKSTPTKREVTTSIDDFEMEPLTVEGSPRKVEQKEKIVAALAPSATSTPGKIILQKQLAKTDVQLAMQATASPGRPRPLTQISGRRAIRPLSDYTPSKFNSNSQFRESYRRINTELDVTNTSLNVTVGSEIANTSFSFFGLGRKRERTPPQLSQSAIGELQNTEMLISPPKRARLDFFSVVSSPLTMLRHRFSKASIQSSTPVKLQQKIEENEEIEVQNVSGVSVHEDLEKSAEGSSDCAAEASIEMEDTDENNPAGEALSNADKQLPLKTVEDSPKTEDGDIIITEINLQSVSGDQTHKNKRCLLM